MEYKLIRIKPDFDPSNSIVRSWMFGFEALCQETGRRAYIDGFIGVSEPKRHQDYTKAELKELSDKLFQDSEFESKLKNQLTAQKIAPQFAFKYERLKDELNTTKGD